MALFGKCQQWVFPLTGTQWNALHVSKLSSIVDGTVYLFYLAFDPKLVAITVTFVTQPFQFNFTTSALSWLTIFRLRSAGSSFFVSSFNIPFLPFCGSSERENAKVDILWVQQNYCTASPLYYMTSAGSLNSCCCCCSCRICKQGWHLRWKNYIPHFTYFNVVAPQYQCHALSLGAEALRCCAEITSKLDERAVRHLCLGVAVVFELHHWKKHKRITKSPAALSSMRFPHIT